MFFSMSSHRIVLRVFLYCFDTFSPIAHNGAVYDGFAAAIRERETFRQPQTLKTCAAPQNAALTFSAPAHMAVSRGTLLLFRAQAA
jgi:hypothetical protein